MRVCGYQIILLIIKCFRLPTALCLLLPLRQLAFPNCGSQYILLSTYLCHEGSECYTKNTEKKPDFGRRISKFKMRSVYFAISLIIQFIDCKSAGYPSKLKKHTHMFFKGHLISKGFLVSSNLPKKQQNFCRK